MTALLLVIGFTMAATAAEMDVTCENCPKATDPGIIPIGAIVSSQYGTSNNCDMFDYETGDGYCEDYDHGNRIIFTLCDCTRGTFNAGDDIPVRMTVLTDGVYWNWESGVPVDSIVTNLNALVNTNNCPTDFDDVTGSTNNADVVYTFTMEDGSLIRTSYMGGALQGTSSELASNGSVLGPWSASVAAGTEYTNTIGMDCTLTDIERIKTITVDNIYTITATDVSNNLQKFQINIPYLRYDINEITSGDSVTVQIEYGGVVTCGSCFACECQRTIGVLGACASASSECMYFPFVFTDMAPWDTGIVVTNLSTAYGTLPNVSAEVAIADMEATFVYTDNTGAEYTYTKADFDSTVWAFMMGAFVANLSGTPASGNGWLLVSTNFAVDGYQFLTNGTFGAGAMPRGCCTNGLCGD
jgi:hypothetical protein